MVLTAVSLGVHSVAALMWLWWYCRKLASKAAQALLLLRTIAAANVNRLVNRLDNDGRRALKDLVSASRWWFREQAAAGWNAGGRVVESCIALACVSSGQAT